MREIDMNTTMSLADLNPADITFEPVSVSHGRTMYRDSVRGLLHASPEEGRAQYSWTRASVAERLAEVPGGVEALDRVMAAGWRVTGMWWTSNNRLSINLDHFDSRWGVQVGVNFDRDAERVRRAGDFNEAPACPWEG
jgi:hypothetical protein